MVLGFIFASNFGMLAPQNNTNDITDALSGSLTTWYQNVDSALKASECVPGYYEYAQAPSYGTQCPIQEGGSTKIDIQTARFNVIDIDNSYIDVDFTVPISLSSLKIDGDYSNTDGTDTDQLSYYVGFKSAFDIIDQYRIYSNGDLVYTQNHANFESFLNYIALTDTAKNNNECFATWDKIQAMDPGVPGTYIVFEDNQDKNITIPLKLSFKIPLNSFMILQNLKWFPGFMGQLTIEIYPTYKNLVWCRVDQTDMLFRGFVMVGSIMTKSGTIDSSQANNGDMERSPEYNGVYKVGNYLAQINSSLHNGLQYINDPDGDDDGWNVMNQTISASTSTLNKFHLYTAFYMLKMDVYNSLEYNYLQVPLLFPIQTVSNVKFTKSLGTGPFTLQNTATLSHCDTVFVVFPSDVNSRTCFTNPEITCQLNINGKYYPRERVRTVHDPRFINMVMDSLNINNNSLVSVSKDVIDSLKVYCRWTHLQTTENCLYSCATPIFRDNSNFFIGVPLSTDEDFMGGISSNGQTVQIELVGDRTSDCAKVNSHNWTEAPEAIFLEDKILKIYSMKPAGRKQVDITNATLEQIAAGAL